MIYYKIQVETNTNLKDTIINLFFQNNFSGILEQLNIYNGNIIITGFTTDNNEIQIKNLKASINALKFFGINEDIITNISKVDDNEWSNSWKQYYKPFNIGNIVIKPSWETYIPKVNEKVIEIDPGVAFGTGQHPTTELCINAILDYLKPTDIFIDAGCGSGILCLVASTIGFDHGYAFDIEESAVDCTKNNLTKSQINNIKVFRANSPESLNEKVDIIFANIIASVIKLMAPSLKDILKENGILIASGIIESKYEDVLSLFLNLGFELIEKRTKKEWVCLILRRKLCH